MTSKEFGKILQDKLTSEYREYTGQAGNRRG